METRFLPALSDYKGNAGARATRWAGWANPMGRAVDIVGRVNITHPADVDKVENRCGCYAILYRAASDSYYTAYVGFSRTLRTEIRNYYRTVAVTADFPFTAVYISNAEVSRAYELDLIRYYSPPWNVKFHR